MDFFKNNSLGILLTAALAVLAQFVSGFVPYHLVSAGVFALLIGMALHPLANRYAFLNNGFQFVSKKVLKLAIIFMGVTLSFAQVLRVGKFSLFVMGFTLVTAFGGGYLLGKLFHMDWKLSGLISAGTGICGGSAIAAIAPAIDAEDSDIAYAISATFLFDIIMVVLFPLIGHLAGMSDMGYGLWAGTAVNDTSSVVAAGYAFSDAAGNFSIIVKLTRTLSIIPAALIFSLVNQRIVRKNRIAAGVSLTKEEKKINLNHIFPWFILMFLGVVAIKSTGILSDEFCDKISLTSKFFMVMALGAIGLKTDFRRLMKSGIKPMFHGFLISALVVAVSFGVQMMLGQL